jgi:hypothetical protein
MELCFNYHAVLHVYHRLPQPPPTVHSRQLLTHQDFGPENKKNITPLINYKFALGLHVTKDFDLLNFQLENNLKLYMNIINFIARSHY